MHFTSLAQIKPVKASPLPKRLDVGKRDLSMSGDEAPVSPVGQAEDRTSEWGCRFRHPIALSSELIARRAMDPPSFRSAPWTAQTRKPSRTFFRPLPGRVPGPWTTTTTATPRPKAPLSPTSLTPAGASGPRA